MSNNYDYAKIDPPSGEDPTEWHFSHRRAWILENEIREKGAVELVNWSELADLFNKSTSTLHRDKQRLVEYLARDVDEDRFRARGRALFEKGLLDLQAKANDPEEDEVGPERIANYYRMWVKTLREFGQLPPAADDPRHKEDDTREVPESISVGIAGVPADGFDPDEFEGLPEQDLPDEEEEQEQEAEA